LWQLGVAPPDRFPVFAVLAVSIAVTTLLTTQTLQRGKRRFVTAMVIAGVSAGVAITGIPETFTGTGSLSDGCQLEVASGTETATPQETSPFDPLDTTPTDTLTWTSSTDEVLTNWDSSIGMIIIGIPVTLWSAERPNTEQFTSWTGSEKVDDYLDRIEDETGLEVRGTFHIGAAIDADGGDCDMAGYLRVNAEGVFATELIIALWAAGALLAVINAWLAVAARRSIRQASRYNSAVVAEAPAEPTAAPDPEPIGAFVPATPAPQPESAPPAASEATGEPTAARAATADSAAAKERSTSADRPRVAREHTVYAERPADEDIPVLEPDGELEPVTEPVAKAEATADGEPATASDSDEEPKAP
jgi:hypothetical protein